MSSILVSRPAPHELLAALRVLVSSRSTTDQELRVERSRDALTQGKYDPNGLFITRNTLGRVNGAILVQAMPGGLGVAWPPRGENRSVEDALTQTACAWLRSCGVKVCQAFASVEDRSDLAPLERNGFPWVTQLVFLRRELEESVDRNAWPRVAARCRAWSGVIKAEEASVLLATHEGTLDCPELNTGRTSREIIEGFREGQAVHCSWWHTIEVSGEPVGVLLFDQGPESALLELSYLGLIPSARGRGLGTLALSFALEIARGCGYHAISVSVDARNEPALRLYRRHVFVETERRDVFLAQWQVPSPVSD
jgi:GNAT superfamily N-acetyltransferase